MSLKSLHAKLSVMAVSEIYLSVENDSKKKKTFNAEIAVGFKSVERSTQLIIS